MTCQQLKHATAQQGISQLLDKHCHMTTAKVTIAPRVRLQSKTVIQFAVLILRLAMPCTIEISQGLLTAHAASDWRCAH